MDGGWQPSLGPGYGPGSPPPLVDFNAVGQGIERFFDTVGNWLTGGLSTTQRNQSESASTDPATPDFTPTLQPGRLGSGSAVKIGGTTNALGEMSERGQRRLAWTDYGLERAKDLTRSVTYVLAPVPVLIWGGSPDYANIANSAVSEATRQQWSKARHTEAYVDAYGHAENTGAVVEVASVFVGGGQAKAADVAQDGAQAAVRHADEAVGAAKRLISKPKGGARYQVTEGGTAIPNSPDELRQNLDLLQETSTAGKENLARKYNGTDTQGPVRVRVEKAHPSDPAYTGPPDPVHTVDHLHIDRRKNVKTGPWKSKEKVPYPWPF